jgi:hypothetical protein
MFHYRQLSADLVANYSFADAKRTDTDFQIGSTYDNVMHCLDMSE